MQALLFGLNAFAGNFDGDFRGDFNIGAIIGGFKGKGGFKAAAITAPGIFALAIFAHGYGDAFCLAIKGQIAA